MRAQTPDLEALRTIGWTVWDPIGLAVNRVDGLRVDPDAADEYDRYLLAAHDMALDGQPAEQIAQYLAWVRRDHMGLGGSHSPTDGEQQTAKAIHTLATLMAPDPT